MVLAMAPNTAWLMAIRIMSGIWGRAALVASHRKSSGFVCGHEAGALRCEWPPGVRGALEALRVIGEERVPVRVADFADIEARLWSISENLHRTELTALQRSEQIAEFAKLTKERLEAQKQAPADQSPAPPDPVQQYVKMGGKMPRADQAGISAQVPQKMPRGRPEGGDSFAARELGITREEVRRAETIAALPNEVKARAADLGFDDNQSALLEAAKAPTPEAQVEALERRAERARSSSSD
jgi:hypothetical protein